MATDQNALHDPALQDRLVAAVGGMERFSSNWSWRSHSPKQRAESAILGAVETIGDGITALAAKDATADQVEEWTAKAISLWLAWQAAGARTANPMITGPANFPVARNQKANAAEQKRGEEFYLFAHRPIAWLDRRHRSAEKAALSAESATVDHRALEFPGVKLVQNTTLDRIQLLFDGKPAAETISQLKKEAFRWSPREGAWQRQNTNNGVQAAYRVLRFLGHEKGTLSAVTPNLTQPPRPALPHEGMTSL
ncbi:hypothetical protein IL54_3383 [Sphingobium sp. ba1]|jgi:hypothetical protein|uniref:hypothetical protein n=1 Tax=Sphingobium sp. ba1 TaxID=1522072 RepID=UPI000505455A|nr:hypothetical protein [Sphingobium sp. ba1]KFL47956.1 hypothetical protein IL54_3383 [Sphingobium sp. ba1]